MHDRLIRTISLVALMLFTGGASAQLTEQGPSSEFYQSDADFSFELPKLDEGGEVAIQADNQILDDDFSILEGNVTIRYQGVSLKADSITYNHRTRDATAEGNVILDQGPRRLTAERAIYNFNARSGTLFNATASLGASVYIAGETIEKIDDETFRITKGVFTSCELGDPSWTFTLEEGVIRVDDYARLRGTAFRAGGLSIIKLPFLIWPTKRDRAQGFLIPKPGYSSRFGAYVESAYFLPFNEWSDVTLHTDIFSSGLLGAGGQAFYTPSESTSGELDFYSIWDNETDSLEWKYDYEHTQQDLPGGFRGVVDVKGFSDLPFFQRFERDFDLNTISNIYSAAYLTKNTSSYSLNLRADRREHFLGLTDSQVFEQLPALQFKLYPYRLGSTPLYLSLDSSAAYLRSSGTRSLDAEYFRTDLFPTISAQIRTPSWLSIKPKLSIRQTNYTSGRDPLTGQYVDDSVSRSYAQGSLEMTGPTFSRIFSRQLGEFSKFKHVIEPRAVYRYTSDVDEQDRVIRFDSIDSPTLPLVSQTVEYSLVQRILAKEGEDSPAREIMTLTLRQTAALSEPFSVDSDGEETFFTPMSLSLRYNPRSSTRIESTATLSNKTSRVERASLSAALSSGSRYLNATWFSRFSPPESTLDDSSQIRLTGGSPIFGDRLRLDTQLNWDVSEGDLLEQRYLLGFSASCYTIAFEFRDFREFTSILGPTPSIGLRRNRDYQLSISLKNVGTFVDVKGSFDALF